MSFFMVGYLIHPTHRLQASHSLECNIMGKDLLPLKVLPSPTVGNSTLLTTWWQFITLAAACLFRLRQ